VLAGAASNGSGRPPLRSDSPAGRAQVLTQTAPQAAIVIAHDDPAPRAEVAGAEPEAPGRRRFPIVKSLLALLVLLVVGAGYLGWRYTQSQYYVGSDAGQVVIYRGVNQNVAGLGLSHVDHRTGIPMAKLPLPDQSLITATITASSLARAQQIVGNIRNDYQTCQAAIASLAAYRARIAAYNTALAAYKTQYGTTGPVRRKGKVIHTPPARPAGTQPTVPSDCPTSGTGTAP